MERDPTEEQADRQFFSTPPGESSREEEAEEAEIEEAAASGEGSEREDDAEGDGPAAAAEPERSPEDAERERLQRQNDQLIQFLTQKRQEAQSEERAPERPADEPPDPVEDREGFNRWHKQVREYDRWEAQQEARQLRSQQEDAGRRERLWQDFCARYPDYAGIPDVVNAAFLAETNGTAEIGPDPEGMMKRVASRVEALRTRLGGGASAESGKPRRKNRTAGVSAGSGQSGASGGKAAPRKAKSLGKILTEQRAESGFF